MATYNPVPFETLAAFLAGKGFEPKTISTKEGQEVVYERKNHHDPQIVVLVYTSCSPSGTSVRGCGKDAIRVCLVGDAKEGRIGLASAKRVHRCGTTESILARMYERMREMYDLANHMAKGTYCPACGAPKYPDSGKCVRRCYQKQVA